MSLKQRVELAAQRAGHHSLSALARALEISPQSLHALVTEKVPMAEQLSRIAHLTGVSAIWLRTGDPTEAPPWADPVAVARDAVARLSDIDRMRFEAEAALDQAEAEHEPDDAFKRMVELRGHVQTLAKQLAATQADIKQQAATVQALLQILGVDEPPPPDRHAGRPPFQAGARARQPQPR